MTEPSSQAGLPQEGTAGRFLGKVVLVTGGAGNIGSAITRRFAAEGASVVALGRRRDRLDVLVAELGSGCSRSPPTSPCARTWSGQ